MVIVQNLYVKLITEAKYQPINEEAILESFYHYREGILGKVIATIINEAVISHMNLEIASTIMQILMLSNHLAELFISNFKRLVFNYMLVQLEERGVKCLTAEEVEVLSAQIKDITMETTFEELREWTV